VIGRGDGRWLVPVGGMGALVAELERAAREAGAELRTGAEVVSAEPSGSGGPGLTLGVRCGGEELEMETGHLLFCGGPAALARVLGNEHEPRHEDEGSVAKVNMVLERLPRLRCGLDPAKAFAGTFRLCEGYGELARSYREARAGRLPERPPAELYCHTLTDDSILAPELRERGWQTVTLFGLDVPYAACVEEPAGVGEELWRRYVNQMDELLAEPLEDCIAHDRDGAPCVEVVTAADIERELGLEQGNIFASEPSWFFADGEEEPGGWGTATSVPGVHRCGSTAARGGAVSGIPGHNAARAVLNERGLTADGLE
jgi:phytoene dehydrogenase-like protein